MKTKNAIVMLTLALSATLPCEAKIPTDYLRSDIYTVLIKYYPAEKDYIRDSLYYIIKTVNTSATDYDTLRSNFQTFFLTDPTLDWLKPAQNDVKLKTAAGEIALLIMADEPASLAGGGAPLGGSVPAPVQHLSEKDIGSGGSPITADGTNTWGQINLWTGAKLTTPYTITGNKLTAAGNSTDGFIELDASLRYILRQGPKANDPMFANSGTATPNDDQLHLVNPFVRMPDFDARLGYLFRGSSAPTNFNASTIVGAADLYSDVSLGLPILRLASSNSSAKQQVTVEANGGFATDKDHLSLHPNVFVGLGYQGCFSLGSASNQVTWVSRVGYAFIDQPELNSGTNTVHFNSLGEPAYKLRGSPAMGVVVTIPVTSTISLQAGGDAYFTQQQPAAWVVSLGATLDLTKLFGVNNK